MSQLICQSCGMPLAQENQFGTDKDNKLEQEYCIHCYKDGVFTNPDLTLEEMIDICVPFMVQEGMEEAAARNMMQQFLPNLKRWSIANGDEAASYQPIRIVELDAMKLAGIAARTTNANEMSGNGKLGPLWGQFWSEQIAARIPNSTDPGTIYSCYSDYENGAMGEYTTLIGAAIDRDAEVPGGLEVVEVPAAKYAVFTTERGPVTEVVARAWQSIWKWSLTSGEERTFTGDFERYDERSAHPEDAQVDIYIAIR